MSYVVLKELTRSAEDIIMVTSSIMKDMATSSDVVYRANAVRSVIRVIDAQSAQAIERPLKTCIVDKSPVSGVQELLMLRTSHKKCADRVQSRSQAPPSVVPSTFCPLRET